MVGYLILGGVFVISNVLWFIMFLRREALILEMSKLIASRTLSEYDWLKRTSNPPQRQGDGYANAWETDDDGIQDK